MVPGEAAGGGAVSDLAVELLADLAQQAIAQQEQALALFEHRGVVIDKWPPKDIPTGGWTEENFAALDPEVRWQGVVFTLYTAMCSLRGVAERSIEEMEEVG